MDEGIEASRMGSDVRELLLDGRARSPFSRMYEARASFSQRCAQNDEGEEEEEEEERVEETKVRRKGDITPLCADELSPALIIRGTGQGREKTTHVVPR